MKEVAGFHMNIAGIPTRLRYHWPLVCLVGIISLLHGSWMASRRERSGRPQGTIDHRNRSYPESFLRRAEKRHPAIALYLDQDGEGYDVEWDSFGRKGWYTQDPRLKPIEPTSVFTPDTPAIYIVFEVAPLEDPAQFGAQWFQEAAEGKLPDAPMGKDSLEVPGHERYGFLELKRKEEKWPVGKYQVKIFITPLGQQPFHAANQVGTMRFSIVDSVPPAPSSAQK